jgi:hypothetical protein
MAKRSQNQFNKKEAQERFEVALKSGFNTPHKPLKEKPRVRKKGKRKKAKLY